MALGHMSRSNPECWCFSGIYTALDKLTNEMSKLVNIPDPYITTIPLGKLRFSGFKQLHVQSTEEVVPPVISDIFIGKQQQSMYILKNCASLAISTKIISSYLPQLLLFVAIFSFAFD
jgi:ribosome biogenesis protein Nip4